MPEVINNLKNSIYDEEKPIMVQGGQT